MSGNQFQFNTPNEGPGIAECVWMVGGVVGYKLCDRQFDCEHCPFDLAIRDGGHALLEQPYESSTRGLLPPPHAGTGEVRHVGECDLAGSVFYHPGHVWARVEDEGRVRVGLDDFGQRIVGRVYAVALPGPGAEAQEGAACWGVCHQAGETALLSPVPGIIRQINPKLVEQPSMINRDPYGDGWAFIVEPASLDYSLKALYYGDSATRWLESSLDSLRLEVEALAGASSPDIGATLPDGGLAVKDLHLLLGPAQLQKLIDSFLIRPASRQRVGGAGKGR